MAAELATPRLVAPALGTSMVVWTWTLAVWLAGLALGNVWGGRLADRRAKDPAPFLLVGGAGWLVISVFLADAIDALAIPAGIRAPTLLTVLYGPAAFLLGGVTPCLARRLLGGRLDAGRWLGLLSAAGALGSVAGTLFTGFVWLPLEGVRALYFAVAAALVASAALVWPGRIHGPPVMAASKPVGTPPRKDGVAGPWTALAALVGFGVLALESLAGRLTTLHLGASVFTWTSVIAVVLTGLAIGAVWGGRLADRVPATVLVRRLLVVSSVLTATALWTPVLLEAVARVAPGPWALRVLLGSTAAWLAPALVLGMVGPALVRAALRDPSTDGRVVGRMAAASTLGAVAASALVPLVLIPWLQTSAVTLATSLLLAMGAWRVAREPRGRDAETSTAAPSRSTTLLPWCATLVLLLFAARAPVARDLGLRLGLRADTHGAWVEDSRYFRIHVAPTPSRWARLPGGMRAEGWGEDPHLASRAVWDEDAMRVIVEGAIDAPLEEALRARLLDAEDRPRLEALVARSRRPMLRMAIDRLVHGFVDPQDPMWLEYEYERVTAALVAAHAQRSAHREAPYPMLFLGGGTYTFQRHARAALARPGPMTTLEIDPAVTRAAREAMALPEFPDHTIVHEDARAWLANAPEAERFALVLGDVFHDIAVPWHLTTRACFASIRARLQPGGIYVMNVVDDPASGPFLGAIENTLRLAFPHTAAFVTRGNAGSGRDTVLFVASDAPLDDLLDAPVAAGEALRASPARRKAWRDAAEGLVLTDDHAPVEWLLAPVFIARGTGPR